MKLPQLDFNKIKLAKLEARHSKVNIKDFGKPLQSGDSLKGFFSKLPNILAAADLKEAAQRIVLAKKNGAPVILALGGHVIKVGLAPIIIDLMEKGVLDALAGNGSVMVHDLEAALVGATSEDVAASLEDGSFGVTGITGELINKAAQEGSVEGLGASLGKLILAEKPPFLDYSLFGAASRLHKNFTVHVALGTDVYHLHPSCRGSEIGEASMVDFKKFCQMVASLENGVFINLGSAVIMPEVFLKALTVVRNLGHKVNNITTINMDFIKHYRPQVNVVSRPTQQGGKGYYFIGHHEIMFPLLMALVLELL